MGSRKESLKKSLGITEYPWSSDDEDNNNNVQPTEDVHVLRRPSGESRISVADMPGTSGAQPSPDSPSTTQRQQAKMDRALFWSIINNTPRPSNTGANRSRLVDAPVNYFSRPVAPSRGELQDARRPERPAASGDIQRILAFKKLTRSLHNISQNKSNSNLYPACPRRPEACSVPPRRRLFSPSLAMKVVADARARLHDWPNSQSNRSSLPESNRKPVSLHYRSLLPRPDAAPDADANQSLPGNYVNIENSDDDVEAVPDATPADEQRDETNPEEENVDDAPHNTSAGAISLEEEIVEVDAPDEPDIAPPAAVEPRPVEPTISNDTNAVAVNSDENVETPQQQSPYHGVKRKRESNEENGEPYSIQEFNQNLLRLLECPVCLEWMEPPISQCRRGHLVCSRCRTRLASCPVCRTTFSSVRNRAMEGVAEMLRYPCRHGCGREVRLRRRAPHEASCGSRRYHCPAPPCARHPPLAHHDLAHHFQCKHLPILKIGRKHKFSMKVNSEQHDTWLIMALDEYFHLRVDVDIRTWGVIVYVAYIGPKRKAKYYSYEVIVEGQHNARSLKYSRATHSDLESSSLNVSRQDCFHLTLDQALNFLRFKNRHCEPDKFLDFDVEIARCNVTSQESKDDSDS